MTLAHVLGDGFHLIFTATLRNLSSNPMRYVCITIIPVLWIGKWRLRDVK